MNCAIYDLDTGAILRVVACPPAAMEKQAREGEAMIELPPGFTGNDATHRVENGQLVPIL